MRIRHITTTTWIEIDMTFKGNSERLSFCLLKQSSSLEWFIDPNRHKMAEGLTVARI